jgi:DNA replication and repair protein RecF
MIIESLELQNFRNYENLKIEFAPKTNIFYGDNAQGKTNILEALYVSATTKSHKSTRDREMIRFDQKECHIRTRIEKHGITNQVDIHLKQNHPKGIAVNRLPIRKASDLFGILSVVLFSPEDLNLIKNGPAQRRRFMDMELCQIDRIYLSVLSDYNRVLLQRNKLLKEIDDRPDWYTTLKVWNTQMVHYGSQVIRQRQRFIRSLNEIVREIHQNLTGGKEQLVLAYEPNVEAEEYEQVLEQHEDQDRRMHTSGVGPHRDDILFQINGIDIRKFGSQGQQRSAALSLKIAEIELIRQTIHDTPVLLLDDVLSELDSSRQNYLLSQLTDVQTMITCTGLDEFVKNRFQIDRVFYVKEGTVTEQEE